VGLKTVTDSLDSVEEHLQSLYVEKDGKFYLDMKTDDLKDHPATQPLRNALERVRKEKGDLQTKLDEASTRLKDVPEDFSLEEYERLLALDDADHDDPKSKEKSKEKRDERLASQRQQYEQRIANLTKDFETKLAERDAELEKERGSRATEHASRQLDEALDKAGIDPKFKRAVSAMHKDSVRSRVEEDGSISAFIETDLGESDVRSFIENWSKSDEGKTFLIAPDGPDARGNNNQRRGPTGENPFSKNHWNKTKQATFRTDVAAGERLAKAAGFTSLEAGLKATRPLDPASS
jgi:DNA-binding transcriptional MerR regulator